ncbi:uncharacterized protein LOC141619260 [Silene latifolia]|uniref:uncharacterized protein LOC141619260 n=1 Tax=Silene latifolia TaxID=37657 RepID=UPI003D785769
MTEDDSKNKGKINGKQTIPITSPLYLHPSDNPNLMLTQTIFNGKNYDLWVDAVKNGLDAKNKLGFVEGEVKNPQCVEGDDSLELWAWSQCSAMLKAGLRNVIDPKLHPSITFTVTVSNIWDELRDHYSKIFKCTCGEAAMMAKEREEEIVHQFLMGFDTTLYGAVRTNLLMEDPITSLTRAYALMLREERHSSITKIKEAKNEVAMAVKPLGARRGRGGFSRQETDEEEQPSPKRNYCGKYYHVEENCSDKHGYEVVKGPEGGRGR